MHARKSLLLTNNSMWIKRHGDLSFDVTMGSFDGAEICKLEGLYILIVQCEKYDKGRLGLYRDDGLICLQNTSGPCSDRIRK